MKDGERSRNSLLADLLPTFTVPRQMPDLDDQHPSREELLAFLTGRMDDEDISSIERHIDGCSNCCAALADLNQTDDAFLASLRSADLSSDKTVRGSSLPSHTHGDTGDATVVGDRTGSRIGPYKLLEPLGEGGMGIVYLCEQTEPVRRQVALKVIKPGMATRHVIERFEAERQALAMMDHACIARVFDAGTTADGLPYFVMELVSGLPITQFCDEQRLAVRDRLELFVQVCNAVQHAHQKGIIHRDLKPTNVLVCRGDGRPIPKIIDFGVAKALAEPLTEGTMATRFGQIVGTLEYMSPEQAELDKLDIDTCSDVYSLGVMLYELLTGTTPLESLRLRELPLSNALRIIREEDPPKPSTRLSRSKETRPAVAHSRNVDPQKLNALLRGDLDWIVMKTLEKEPAHRYATANALARDIQRYLKHEPIEARPPSTRYWLMKLVRRQWKFVATALAIVALLVLGTVISVTQAIRATNAQQQSMVLALERQDAVLAAQEARDTSQHQLAQLTFLKGVDQCRKGSVGEGMFTLLDAWRLAPETNEELRRVIRTNLAAWQRQLPLLRTAVTIPRDSAGEFDLVPLGPLGDRFLVKRGQQVLLFDSHSGTQLRGQLPIAADEQFLSVVGNDHLLVETATGEMLIRALQNSDEPDRIVPDELAGLDTILIEPSHQEGRYLCIERKEFEGQPLPKYQFRFRYLDTPSQLRLDIPAVRGMLLQIIASDDGKDVLVVFDPRHPEQLDFWNLESGKPTQSLSPQPGQPGPWVRENGEAIMLASLFRDGIHWSKIGLDGALRWWDPQTGKEIGLPWQPRRNGPEVNVGPNGSVLLSHGTDGQIRMFDIASGLQRGGIIPTRKRTRKPILNLWAGPNGSVAMTADRNVNVWVWDMRHARLQQSQASNPRVATRLPAETLKQIRLAFHPTTRRALLCAPPEHHRAWLIDLEQSSTIGPPIQHDRPVNPTFSPDGSLAATTVHNYAYGGEPLAYIWNASTGRPVAKPLLNRKYVFSVALSPDNQTIALGGPGGTFLWNYQDSRILHALPETTAVQRLLFNDEGTILATGCRRGWKGVEAGVRLWNVKSGKPIGPFIPTGGDVLWQRFSPAAHRLLGLSEFGELRVVDTDSGEPALQAQLFTVLAAADFTSDATRVVAANLHGRLQQWDIATGNPVGPHIETGSRILAVHYSLNGRLLATLDAEGAIQIWDSPTGLPIGPPLMHRSNLVGFAWSTDGKHLHAVTESASSHTFPVDGPVLDQPDRMEDWLVVHSGYHPTSQGLQLLSGDQWRTRVATFEQQWPEPDPALAISSTNRETPTSLRKQRTQSKRTPD